MDKPIKTLGKCNSHEVMEEQLTITSKEIITIFVFVVIFGILCFLIKGPTYGML